MTDQIPADLADKVRKIASEMRDAMRREDDGYLYADFLSDMSDYIRDLEALLPAPPRPTLADMTADERAACRWMQADVENRSVRYVLVNPCDAEGDAALVDPYGEIEWLSPERVTPRPDLRRMTWPGNEKPAPALPGDWRLADHPVYGRVIVTNTTPNKDGRVAVVLPTDDPLGYDWLYYDPDELTFLDQEDDAPMRPDTLAVGTVIESADDPRLDALPVGSILLDRDEEATTKLRGDWAGIGYIPIPSEGAEFAPWTVLHIPKEDDQ